jgi:hypothetical protein
MYLYGDSSTHGMSGLAADGGWEQFGVHLKITFKWKVKHSPMPWSNECGDALGVCNPAYLDMYLEAVIKGT